MEVSAAVRVETPLSPETSVCPSDALSVSAMGAPVVDARACVGCGLCVVRCPVGAIKLNAASAVAEVCDDELWAYHACAHDPIVFADERSGISSRLRRERAPFADADLVRVQLARLDSGVQPLALQRVYRLLSRNAFLSLGASARLKNVGDNNAFAELAIGVAATLVLVEVEPKGDMLDALRRVVAGVAIVRSRYGVAAGDVIPCIVMDKLPNVRVDYYEAVQNAESRIGVSVRSIPAAALLLGIRSGDDRLLRLIREAAVLHTTHPSLEEEASALWGSVSGLGLRASK
jgi:ferredoxin